ncbi:hypothetical protein [Shewanella livingstonensis]|uniref:Uncharacterized protein n=1 Tax=Shewanella livingstonensis TaxID=150120 RepID=A0A3G8LXA6_9GAMM|nr:hypothetical protein [Shewanella livingstonensis]AZG73532.1 hypothetical protein EGC82_12630 [Shewanella livingstonensis]
MSTKEYVYEDNNSDFALFQEITFDDENNNPAVLQIDNASNFSVFSHKLMSDSDKVSSQLIAEIPADEFDKIAIEWCKKRKLHGALGGPVGLEFGSPDCKYD